MDSKQELNRKPEEPHQKTELGESEVKDDIHKTSLYVRTIVELQNLRDQEAADSLNEKRLAERDSKSWEKTQTDVASQTRKFFRHPNDMKLEYIPQKYGYVFRPKSFWELVQLSGTVCGIEFCYSAETAFVTPILLNLGLNIKFATMAWCLSPLIGLFFTPILGSMSDSCESRMGRRRPFILLYSIGILLGLVLVPNGHAIGLALGDKHNIETDLLVPNITTAFNDTHVTMNSLNHPGPSKLDNMIHAQFPEHITIANILETMNASHFTEVTSTTRVQSDFDAIPKMRTKRSIGEIVATTKSETKTANQGHVQPWSIAFTVIGTMLLDFCSDACQSPSRTYLMDVSLPDDHAAGLSTFTLMAGLGGSMGFIMGAIHWEETFLGHLLGGQVNTVFTMVTIIFILCLISTLCSFSEIPLPILQDPKMLNEYQEKIHMGSRLNIKKMVAIENKPPPVYGATSENNGFHNISEQIPASKSLDSIPEVAAHKTETAKGNYQEINISNQTGTAEERPSLKDFLKSLILMPKSLKVLCLTNLFCWMSLVSYSLYFTDFVAECVFGGDPQAPEKSEKSELYTEGVQFGCWGMALNSLSCAVYSYFIDGLVKKIGAKPTYIGGQLVYCLGMIVMAITRHKVAIILLSTTAGIMYATLFTMPYILIAHYHSTNTFSSEMTGVIGGVRGIGTDVAAVSSMVFLSQFTLSVCMGSIVELVGSKVVSVCAAAILSGCGALSATQVLYLDI